MQRQRGLIGVIAGEARHVSHKCGACHVGPRQPPRRRQAIRESLRRHRRSGVQFCAWGAAASRSTRVSVGVNLVLTTTEIAADILSTSQGLTADGIHTLSAPVTDFVVPFDNHHCQKDEDADHPCGHHRFEMAAGLVLGALRAKELQFRYRLAVAQRVKSSPRVANAWHARSDAASSLVVGIGMARSLAGYPIPIPDPTAAAIVGFWVAKMGWAFGWDALHDLMDRSIDAVAARDRVLQRHRLLNLMTHVDPWRRPDLDHVAARPQAQR